MFSLSEFSRRLAARRAYRAEVAAFLKRYGTSHMGIARGRHMLAQFGGDYVAMRAASVPHPDFQGSVHVVGDIAVSVDFRLIPAAAPRPVKLDPAPAKRAPRLFGKSV